MHQTRSNFINDWKKTTIPETNQNITANQLSSAIVDKSIQLNKKEIEQVNTSGVLYEY